jgi:ribosomal-protein-alanine N-acetyltransferase
MRERRVEIVPMVEDDIDAVMEIERGAYRSPWSRKIFTEEMHREWARLEVVRERDAHGSSHVVAYCNYWLVRDEVHLLNLATHADKRRHGYGRALLAHLIDFGRRHRCRYVTLEVRRSNTGAIVLYKGFGFQIVGVRLNYYVEDKEDALVMLLEL